HQLDEGEPAERAHGKDGLDLEQVRGAIRPAHVRQQDVADLDQRERRRRIVGLVRQRSGVGGAPVRDPGRRLGSGWLRWSLCHCRFECGVLGGLGAQLWCPKLHEEPPCQTRGPGNESRQPPGAKPHAGPSVRRGRGYCFSAASCAFLMSSHFLRRTFSSSLLSVRKGTCSSLLANLMFRKCWPSWMPPGTLKYKRPRQTRCQLSSVWSYASGKAES